MAQENYVSRTPRLMKSFDRAISLVEPILDARYGAEAYALVEEARQYYRDLIPEIPYFGENNILLDMFFFPASRHLGIYKAFRERGKTLEEVGQLVFEIGEAEINTIPALVRRIIAVLWFSHWFTNRLEKRARFLSARKHLGGYEVEFVRGDGIAFDFEFDYHQCAVLNFYRQQGAAELVPYICAIDKIASDLLGWGLHRTMTLAAGGSKCDFQFKKGGKTRLVVPQSLV
jgi:hypothetical protein